MDLSYAAWNGNLEHVSLLIEQGSDKDKGDGDVTSTFYGQPPLYLASRNGHLDVVQYLVEQGVIRIHRVTDNAREKIFSLANSLTKCFVFLGIQPSKHKERTTMVRSFLGG